MTLGLHTFLNTCLRILSVLGIQCMAIIGGASMIGDIPVYKAAIAFADDGILSKEELDSAFNGSSTE